MKTNKLTVAVVLATLTFASVANALLEFPVSENFADLTESQTNPSPPQLAAPGDLPVVAKATKALAKPPLTLTAPVPEPSTIVAGLLMLLPFGACALRILRKPKPA